MARTVVTDSGPATLCAWCGVEIDERTQGRGRTGLYASHGLCRSCSDSLIGLLGADAPPLSVLPRTRGSRDSA